MPWKNEGEQRKDLVRAMQRRREPVVAICERFGVSRSFAYRLNSRFEASGWPGVTKQKRGPKGRWTTKREGHRRWILAERRRHPSWGGRKLWWRLRAAHARVRLPSVRTLERWLRAAGVVRPRRRRQRLRPEPLRSVRAVRRSNDRWSFDWKGWIRTGDGRRFEPLTVRDEASRKVLWAAPLLHRSEAAVRQVCERLFQRYGVPKAIRTDLGGPFCGNAPHGFTTLSVWWHRLGIAVEFVNARARLHNNAHEQMHQVLAEETGRAPAPSYRAQLARVRHWVRVYNTQRPHEALGGRTPEACYRAQPCPLPVPLEPSYAPTWLVRTVARSGTISLGAQRRYVGRAWGGCRVGCRPLRVGHDVYFAGLLLVTLRPSLDLQPPNREGEGR